MDAIKHHIKMLIIDFCNFSGSAHLLNENHIAKKSMKRHLIRLKVLSFTMCAGFFSFGDNGGNTMKTAEGHIAEVFDLGLPSGTK